MGGNLSDTLLATLAMIPFMLFWILYPNWGSTLYGEVRGSGDFRKVLRGMLGGIWVTAGLALAFVLLAARTFGWDFFTATNANFINNFYGYTTTAPTVPIWSYPPLLASYLIDNSIFQIGMVVLFGVWFLGWSGTLFLSSTRMIFAAAFDRVLPDHAAQVSERRAVPIIALLYIMVPAVVVSIIYAYSADFRALTLDATLVIAVTFLGSAVAATILPWYKPKIFDNSPVAHLKLVVSGAGLITVDHPRLDGHPVAQGSALRDRGGQHQFDHLPRRRLWRRGDRVRRCAGSFGAARASTSTPSIRRSRPNRPGQCSPRIRRLGSPGAPLDSAAEPAARARFRVLPDVLGFAIFVEPGRTELAADPRLLEAAPFRLGQVRVVVVDPDRPVAQAGGDPLGAARVRGPDGPGEPVGRVVGRATASSSVVNRSTVMTGPKTSSRTICIAGVTSAKTVGR